MPNCRRVLAVLLLCVPLTTLAAQGDTIVVTWRQQALPQVELGRVKDVGAEVAEDGRVTLTDRRLALDEDGEPVGELTYVLRGTTDDGAFKLDTKHRARVVLDALRLTSREGAAIHLKNKKRVELVVADGTSNSLTIAACADTASHKAAALWAKDKLVLAGSGRLDVLATGDGCKGIRGKDDITLRDLALRVETQGDNLGVDTTRQMPFGAPDMSGPPPGGFHPDSLPEEVRAHFEEMRQRMEQMHKERGEMGPPEHPDGQFGPPQGGKQKYIACAKAVKSQGIVKIESGHVEVVTASPGAEGIEGKQGIVIDGGTVVVHSPDDAINAGGQIVVNGGHVTAHSTGNDAVDSNYGESQGGGGFPPFMQHDEPQEPGIVVTGGTLWAWSQNGPPEEGLDCDSAPIRIAGGTVFSIGAGMGDMPSVPTQDTAEQPTALLIGLQLKEREPVRLTDSEGQVLCEFAAPFDFQHSSSLISSPAFRVGETYTVTSAGQQHTFTLDQQFTIVR